MEIYADLLLLENISINYFILYATARVVNVHVSKWRMFLSAFIGSCGVFVYIFFPDITFFKALLFKFIVSLVMVYIAFKIGSFRNLIAVLSSFYISTFILAGLMFAMVFAEPYIMSNDYGFLVNMGIRKMVSIVLSILSLLILVQVFWDTIKIRILRDSSIVSIKIGIEERCIKLQALLDTGNLLYDPLTNAPVIIVESNAIAEIIPDEINDIIQSQKVDLSLDLISQISESAWKSRLRLIPFKSLGNENGLLVGFKPDYVEINQKRGERETVLAIYNKSLTGEKGGGAYNAIIGPQLV